MTKKVDKSIHDRLDELEKQLASIVKALGEPVKTTSSQKGDSDVRD